MTMATDEIRFGRQVPWFTCYTTIWKRDDLDAESKLVYINLASHAGNNQRAWPSYDTIARETSLSRRCVITRIKILIAKNLLVKRHRFENNGKQTSNLFIVFPAHNPFRPDHEFIDSDGNLVNIPQDIVGAHGAPQDLDIGVHAVHCGGAHGALKYDQFNNNVVVEDNAPKKIDKPISKTTDQEKVVNESPTIISPAAAPISLADINRVVDAVREATCCLINQQDAENILSRWSVDYVLGKINDVLAGNPIKDNVTGWIIRCCEGDWKKVKPDKRFRNSKPKAKPVVDVGNSYFVPADERKKAMLEALYRN